MKQLLMRWGLCFALAAGIAPVAYGQQPALPRVTSVGPNDLFPVIPGGVPDAQGSYATASQISGASAAITSGVTPISGGATGTLLYETAGSVLGNATIGSGLTFSGGVLSSTSSIGGLTVGTSPISGGSNNTFVYDGGGYVQVGTFGSGLSFSGGVLSATGTGSGTITGVTAGTGLTGGGTSGTVTLNLGSTGVTAGAYTNANITINAQGQVTAAANGSASGGLAIGTAITGGSTGTLLYETSGGLLGNITLGTNLSLSGGTLNATASGGGLTSVGLTLPSIFSSSNNPLTSNGNIPVTLVTQTSSYAFMAPTAGGTPLFRAIVPADLPVATSGALGVVRGDGTTVTNTAGVLSAPTTIGNTITGGTSGYFLWDNAGALAVGSFGSGLSFNTSTGVLTSPNTPPVQTVTNRYATGGATTLPITDNLSLISTNSGTTSTYTLPNDSVDGHAHTVKRFGPGNVVVNALIDGVSQSITMNTSGTVKESIVLAWDAADGTYLYLSGD